MGKKAKRKTPQRYRPQQQQQPDESPGESTESGVVVDPVVDQEKNAEEHGDEVDPGSEEPLKCRHFKRGVNLEKLGERLESLTTVLRVCPSCSKDKKHLKHASGKKKKQLRKRNSDQTGSEDAVWICLACGYVGCEKLGESDGEVRQSFGTGHAVEHFRRERHPFVLHFGDALCIWCLDCGSPLVTQAEAVNGLEGLGQKGKALQQAVKLVQESYIKKVLVRNRGYEQVSTDGLLVEKPKNGVIRGLMNLGNTCFFNSVMQNLLAVRLLKDHFLNSEPVNEGPLTSALRRFFQEINYGPEEQESSTKRRSREGGTYNPKGLFGAVCAKSSRFSGYQQQDSHELLRCLLDGLEEEGSKSHQQVQHAETFIDKLFGGQFASTVRCCECGYSSSVSESFLDISLPIPVPEGGKANGGQSKRELKAKKSMDRRKMTTVSKAAFEPLKKVVVEKHYVKEQSASCSASVVEDVSWLDYVGDDFVDVALDGGSSAYDEQLLEAVAVEDSINTASSDLNVMASEQLNASSITGESSVNVAEVVEATTDHSDSALTDHSLAAVPSPQDVQVSTGGEEAVQPLDEVDVAASAPSVIVLPWEGQPAQTGWEILPANNDSDGIADLFHEEEAPVMVGCPNKDEAAPYEEPEDIVEKSIVPMTLEGCLLAFTKLELLSGENAWECDNCSKHAEERTRADAFTTPSVAEEPRSDDDTESSTEGVIDEDSRHLQRGKCRRPPKRSEGTSSSVKQNNSLSVRRNATKSLVIKKAPPVLTVHLKRFAQDMRGKLSKLTGHVAFEEMLNLNKYRGTRDTDENCLYRLVGVVEHSGTMRGGHYVAFVRGDAEDGKQSFWYYISDSDVRMTTLENVLRSEAYLLFYERV